MGKVLLKCDQFTLLTFIKDNHKIVSDCFVIDSVNVMKNRSLVAKIHKRTSVYINLAQSHQGTMKIVTRNNTTQNFRKPHWFSTNY